MGAQKEEGAGEKKEEGRGGKERRGASVARGPGDRGDEANRGGIEGCELFGVGLVVL